MYFQRLLDLREGPLFSLPIQNRRSYKKTRKHKLPGFLIAPLK